MLTDCAVRKRRTSFHCLRVERRSSGGGGGGAGRVSGHRVPLLQKKILSSGGGFDSHHYILYMNPGLYTLEPWFVIWTFPRDHACCVLTLFSLGVFFIPIPSCSFIMVPYYCLLFFTLLFTFFSLLWLFQFHFYFTYNSLLIIFSFSRFLLPTSFLIVNDVSYVTRIKHAIHFAW